MAQRTGGDQQRGAMSSQLGSMVQAIEGERWLDDVAAQLRRLAEPVSGGGLGGVLRGEGLGHALHPALTDVPIGAWTSAGLLDLLGGRRSRPAARRLIALGLLATAPTAAAGLADWSSAQDDDLRVRRVGAVHAMANLVVGYLYWRSWRSRADGHHLRGMSWSTLGLTFLLGSGYLGRELAYGHGAPQARRDGGEDADRSRSADDGRGRSGTGPVEQDLIDLRTASERLGVPEQQVRAMVDQGLLVPVSSGPTGERFRDGDVEAVRLLGG